MEIATIGWWVAGISAALIVLIFTGLWKVGKENMKKAYGLFVVLLLVGGAAGFGVLDGLQSQTIGGGASAECDQELTIGSLTFKTKDALSGSRTATAGGIEIWAAEDDPNDPVANPIANGDLASGEVTINSSVKTCKPYRLVMDGGSSGTYYSEDFGIVTFDVANYNPDGDVMTVELDELLSEGGFVAFSTISDMLDETTNSTDLNGGNWGGNESASAPESAEIKSATADKIVYDESVGDGQYYVINSIGASGANTMLREAVLCFEFDTTNPPEGNELSAYTVERQSGTDFGIPSSILPYWTDEKCIPLGDIMGGTSGSYKFTTSVTEANLDTNDDYTMYFDDLGDKLAKDIGQRRGATFDSQAYDATA